VASSAIAVDIHQTFDVETDLRAEFSLDFILVFDDVTERYALVFAQVLDPGTLVHTCFVTDLLRRRASNTIYVGKAYDDPFIVRNINTNNTRHSLFSFLYGATPPQYKLPLALLVPLILADHTDYAFSPYDLALATNLSD
jgi:hypothetical protein